MNYLRLLTVSPSMIFALLAGSSFSQQQAAIDADAIIQKVVEVEARQRAEIRDVIFDAEYIELEKDDNGEMKEKMRLEKTVTLTYLDDSISYSEIFNAYYQHGQLMSDEVLAKIAGK